ERLGSQVEAGADQQPPCAGTIGGNAFVSADTRFHQRIACCKKITKAVLLVLKLAGQVSGFTTAAAAAYMGDGKGHTTRQQLEPGDGKPGVKHAAIRSVAIQKCR